MRSLSRSRLTLILAVTAALALFALPPVVMAQTLAPPTASSSLSPTDIQALVGVGGVPVVLAFVGLAKGFVPDDRFYPIMALAVGVAWNLLLAVVLQPPLPIGPALLSGLLSGLTAAGTFSAVKTVRKTQANPTP